MAFDFRKLDPSGSSASSGVGAMGTYVNTDDAVATIQGANYFNSMASALKNTAFLAITGSDGSFIATVSVSAANVVTLPVHIDLA